MSIFEVGGQGENAYLRDKGITGLGVQRERLQYRIQVTWDFVYREKDSFVRAHSRVRWVKRLHVPCRGGRTRCVGRDEMRVCAGRGRRKRERADQSWSDYQNGVKLSLHRFPVQVQHLRTSGLLDKCAVGLCSDFPCEGLSRLMSIRRDGRLWQGIHRREMPGRRELQLYRNIRKAKRRVQVDDRFLGSRWGNGTRHWLPRGSGQHGFC